MALNYFYNAQAEEMPVPSTLLGGNSNKIWLIVLVFLFFTHNDLITCRHGEDSNYLILLALILVLFTKTTS